MTTHTKTLLATITAGAALVAQPSLAAVFTDTTPTGDTIRGEGSGVGYIVDTSESSRIGEGGGSSSSPAGSSAVGRRSPNPPSSRCATDSFEVRSGKESYQAPCNA